MQPSFVKKGQCWILVGCLDILTSGALTLTFVVCSLISFCSCKQYGPNIAQVNRFPPLSSFSSAYVLARLNCKQFGPISGFIWFASMKKKTI